jgi:DNA helicase II / ATP-dependent DNA helicase PcrA
MEFNDQQLAAIQADDKHLLVLAGAGTGKTRTIVGRAARLIREGCSAKRIAIITFTRRAASEIRHRLTQTAAEASKGVVAGTFHNFCLREMSAKRAWFGLDEITIMDHDDQSQLMKLVRAEIVGKGKDGSLPQAAELLSLYSYARNTNRPVRQHLEEYTELHSLAIDQVLKVFEGYKQRKRSAGYVDFDDILHRFAKVMHDDRQICQKIASSYDHVLVDEMQDTNPLQWLILESLAPYVNLFCVGDDAQSIYAFRGADFRNVHSFNQRLPQGKVLKLEVNYRSTQEILDVSNWLLQQSPLKYNKQLTAHRGQGNLPVWVLTDSEMDEAEWVINDVVRHHGEGLQWQDMMIMARSSYAARPFEAELIRRKIPYRFIGGIGLLQMAHIKDLICVLRIAVNHQDELAWMRFLVMWPRIGEVTAAKLVHQVRQSTDSHQAVQRLSTVLARPDVTAPLQLAVELQHDPASCIEQLVKQLEPLLEVRYDNWDNRSRDCKLLIRLAQRHKSLQAFLDAYALDPVSASEMEANQDDILTLITVHSAKGTESKVCYVTAAQAGNYPHSRSLENEDQIEEERRVLYVALTRAQDELVISRHADRARSFWSANRSSGNSCFLDSMPKRLTRQVFAQQYPLAGPTYTADYWDDDVI